MEVSRGCLEVSDDGDDLAADDLQRRDPVYFRDETDYGLDAHLTEPAQLLDQLVHLLAVLSDVEGKRARLLYLIVVSALGLAKPAQDVQLLRDLGPRTQTTGVSVACNKA